MGFLDVARPDAGRKAVDRVVGLRSDLLAIAERNRRDDGPENFFLHHFHFVVGVHEHRGLNEIALGALRAPPAMAFAPS